MVIDMVIFILISLRYKYKNFTNSVETSSHNEQNMQN